MAQCRLCKEKIDKEKDDWIMPSRNYFYHRKCYENWKKAQITDDEQYVDMIYDFIARDLKVSYDWWVCEAQRKKFIKEGKMTNKGILFALKYFYEVKNGDWEKGHGGIGIVPFIYNDSCAYWASKERQSAGTIAKIEQQMTEAMSREEVVLKQTKRKNKKSKVSLNMITDMEDDFD